MPITRDSLAELTIDECTDVVPLYKSTDYVNLRGEERLELIIPAQIITQRGNTVSAITRDISRSGIGLLHSGAITTEEVQLKMSSETKEFEYDLVIEWCRPAIHGLFMSGGRFLKKEDQC